MDPRRVPVIAGNWKMHTTVFEAQELATMLRTELGGLSGVTVVLCPPFVSLGTVGREVGGTFIKLGAQNMHPEPQGAYTGEVSPVMLKDLCQYVILGHSERRAYFGETDALINRKLLSALAHGLRPILCVGETLEQMEGGRREAVLRRQVRGCLAGTRDIGTVVIAYEPVWAIGTGRAATAQDANEAIGYIRGILGRQYNDDAAQATPILYGGSVSAANAGDLLREREIDGALVGGASLKADAFTSIVRQAAEQAAALRL